MKLTKQQKLYVMQYVLDSIDFDGLGYDNTDHTLQAKLTPQQAYRCKIAGRLKLDNITMLVKTLKSEMRGTTKQGTPDYFYVDKLAWHLQGLPSYLSSAFTNHDIIQLGDSWGIELSTEEQQNAWLAQYWLELAHAIHNLSNLK